MGDLQLGAVVAYRGKVAELTRPVAVRSSLLTRGIYKDQAAGKSFAAAVAFYVG